MPNKNSSLSKRNDIGDVDEMAVSDIFVFFMLELQGSRALPSDPFWDYASEAFAYALAYYIHDNYDISDKNSYLSDILEKMYVSDECKHRYPLGNYYNCSSLMQDMDKWLKQMYAAGKRHCAVTKFDTFTIFPIETKQKVFTAVEKHITTYLQRKEV